MGKISRKEIYEKTKVGIMAGFVSGLIILVAFVAIDSELQVGPWTFYAMIGLSVGLHGIQAPVFGVIAHILTAITIGSVFCVVSTFHPVLNITSAWKGILAGGVTGLEVYAIFFMPLTLYLIIPTIHAGLGVTHDSMFTADERIMFSVLERHLPLIMQGAIVFHVLFGAVMGIYSSILLSEKHNIQKRFSE